MALFGNKKEKQEIEVIIRTENSWLTYGTPKVIIRQIVNRGVEKIMNKKTYPISPYVRIEDCHRLVETEDTFEVQLMNGELHIIPKGQVLEIQY